MAEQDPTPSTTEVTQMRVTDTANATQAPRATESLVLSAHTLGILARHIAGRIPADPAAQAFVAALTDAAALADAWVSAQLDARYPALAAAVAPPVAAEVAPPAWITATPTATPATPAPQPTKADAVRAATAQLGPGATAPAVAQLVAQHHGLTVTDASVRAVWSKDRKAALAQPPQPQPQPEAQHGTGLYL